MPNVVRRSAFVLATSLATLLLAGAAQAKVTALGWPGGPEEAALRAAAEAYNAKADTAEADKVDLLFFNRKGFWDKLQPDLAAAPRPSTPTFSPPTRSAATRPSWSRSSSIPPPRRSSANRC